MVKGPDQSRILNPVASVNPGDGDATRTGGSADLRGYDSALAIVQSGAFEGGVNTGITWTPKLQHSHDDSDWADVAAADVVGAFTGITEANKVQWVGYRGTRRYLRVVITPSAATTEDVGFSAVIVRGRPWDAPTQ